MKRGIVVIVTVILRQRRRRRRVAPGVRAEAAERHLYLGYLVVLANYIAQRLSTLPMLKLKVFKLIN